jgi:uncharacterized membrane protein YqjE
VANSASVVELMDDYFRRLLRLVSVLVDMHMDIAIQEANYEKRRLIGGFVMLGIGIGLFTLGGILLQVLGVFVLHWAGLNWMASLLIIAAVDFLIGGIFAAAASRRLKGPLMVQTQARLARSAAMLRQSGNSSLNR